MRGDPMARVTKAEAERDATNLKLRQLVEVVKQDREQKTIEIEAVKKEREEQETRADKLEVKLMQILEFLKNERKNQAEREEIIEAQGNQLRAAAEEIENQRDMRERLEDELAKKDEEVLLFNE